MKNNNKNVETNVYNVKSNPIKEGTIWNKPNFYFHKC